MRVTGICLSAAWLCLGAALPDASFAVEAQLEAIVSQLSAGYGTQDSQRARFSWNGADHSLTQLGLEHKRAFGESAQIFVASHALDLNALDRVSVAVYRGYGTPTMLRLSPPRSTAGNPSVSSNDASGSPPHVSNTHC